jgi:hypothetical protein
MDTQDTPKYPTNQVTPLVRIPAILLFDSFGGTIALGGPLLSGVRGAGPMYRKLLYRAGDYYIDLSLDYVEQERVIDIMGQAVPSRKDAPSTADAHITLRQGSTILFHTQTNEFGEFIIDGVPRGAYDLSITLMTEEIDISGLNAT